MEPLIGAPRLGVVIVNWNRWADTIECLESLLKAPTPMAVVIVDNGSTDGSLDRITAWAAGTQSADPIDTAMARFSQPPAAKPLALTRLAAADIPAFSVGGSPPPPAGASLTLVDAAANLGFAGGNNLGLRLLLARGLDLFWLLNNDTVVDRAAPDALIRRMDATHNVGMCGTIVRFYHRPDTVQALNGSRFSLFSGQSRGIGGGQPASQAFDPAKVARETDFVLGASLAVSRAFLETVGPMHEGYFLYFEEIDWATRAAERFVTAFAHGAIVYHKEGGSIGSSGEPSQRSSKSEYWLTRSRLAFVRRNHPWAWPWHWLLTLPLAARRLLRAQPGKAAAMVRAMFGVGY